MCDEDNFERYTLLEQKIDHLQHENTQLREDVHNAESENPLTCPITKERIRDLVVCGSDGYLYERSAITEWNVCSPLSPLSRNVIVPVSIERATNLHSYIMDTYNERQSLKKQNELLQNEVTKTKLEHENTSAMVASPSPLLRVSRVFTSPRRIELERYMRPHGRVASVNATIE